MAKDAWQAINEQQTKGPAAPRNDGGREGPPPMIRNDMTDSGKSFVDTTRSGAMRGAIRSQGGDYRRKGR